jgi:REDY-like protein HapK
MAIVRFVLVSLKPGANKDDYERYEREVDYVFSGKLASIVSYRTHRVTDEPALPNGPWDYVERIEVTDRAAYEMECATLGKGLLDEIHEKYIDESKVLSFWTESIDP